MIQRFAIAFATCGFIIAVFLHNPISGWTYEETFDAGTWRPCTEQETRKWIAPFKELQAQTKMSDADIQERARACTAYAARTDLLPFASWTSNQPHVQWFGSVQNIAMASACLALMCIVVLAVFRKPAARGKADSNAI